MKCPLLVVFVSALAFAQASDWSHFLGPQRNSTSTETGLLKSFPPEGPKKLWEIPLEEGFGGAAVMGSEVFILDRVKQEKDILRVHDLGSGKELWRFESPSEGEPSYPGSRTVPTVEKDAVYYITPFGNVFRINRKTRKTDWTFKISERYKDAEIPRWGYAQCALVIGDTLIVTPFGSKTGIVALNKKTGQEIWRGPAIGNSHSSPTYLTLGEIPQVAILTAGGTHLTSFDLKSGKLLWQTDLYQNRIPITVPVQIDQERLLVSGGYKAGTKLLTVKKENGKFTVKELWHARQGSQIHPPLVIEDHLYFLANENANYKAKRKRQTGGLTCLSLKGQKTWNTGNDPFMGRGASLYADGMIIQQDGDNGMLRLIKPDPQKYTLLAEANVFDHDPESRADQRYWSNLALSNGHLLMRGQDRMVCLLLK